VADQARSAGTADPEDPWFGATIVPGAEFTAVAVSGELDMCTLEQLRAVLDQLRRTGHHHVMLDLAGLDFLSATGISVIAEHLALTTRVGGSLALSNPSPPIRRVLILTDHHHLITDSTPRFRRPADIAAHRARGRRAVRGRESATAPNGHRQRRLPRHRAA
jgi:anti-sigma B factor antagonist